MSLRYFLEGCRPSKTVSQSFYFLFFYKPPRRFFFTINNSKISRVFSSNWELSVSAPIVKFHAIYLKDSYPIITLFMQDNTYLPRNFATLGSLELQPPVFTDYIQPQKEEAKFSLRKLGQKALRILHYLFCAQLCLWSTVAGLFLPSSFQIVIRKPHSFFI